MATFTISTPNRNFVPLADADASVARGQFKSQTASAVANIKNNYGSMLKEIATNSNIPAELLGTMIVLLSDGKNNSAFKTPDRLVRSGIFSLSQKVAKEVLSREVAQGRLSQAEKAYLSASDPAIASYLGERGTKQQNQHWNVDVSNPTKINDTSSPFNLLNPKVSAQIGAIWLGQVWDAISKQTVTNPIDKVIITMALPYGRFGTQSIVSDYGNSFLSGNRFVLSDGRSMNIDYTNPKNITMLPSPANFKDKVSVSNIINPNGGDIRMALRIALAKDGALDLLSR